ncbi:MAG: heavy-metal-associated domain-containing protein [Chloroflexi bacterium]|nr:heavy-metal-associated domain-containing protein [Chloroflexota bacterium]
MEKVTLHAPDISCDHCIRAIQRVVSKLPGVQEVAGDPATKRVQVAFDPAQASLARIKEAMAEEGYPVAG